MENLVPRLSYHIAVAALQRQNELHLFAMCLAINIYVVIQGSKKNDKMNQVVSLLVLSTKISPKGGKKNNQSTSMNLSFTSERNRMTSITRQGLMEKTAQ